MVYHRLCYPKALADHFFPPSKILDTFLSLTILRNKLILLKNKPNHSYIIKIKYLIKNLKMFIIIMSLYLFYFFILHIMLSFIFFISMFIMGTFLCYFQINTPVLSCRAQILIITIKINQPYKL